MTGTWSRNNFKVQNYVSSFKSEVWNFQSQLKCITFTTSVFICSCFWKTRSKVVGKIQNVLENVFLMTKSKFTTVYQRPEYWILIMHPWSTDESNIASTPLPLAWSCSPLRWDPACCWNVVEVEVGVFICVTSASWLQSRCWTFQ